jgi:hypothetical protein
LYYQKEREETEREKEKKRKSKNGTQIGFNADARLKKKDPYLGSHHNREGERRA